MIYPYKFHYTFYIEGEHWGKKNWKLGERVFGSIIFILSNTTSDVMELVQIVYVFPQFHIQHCHFNSLKLSM